MAKVSVIGAGNVGGMCALRIAELGVSVMLLDIAQELCQGKCLDTQDSLSFLGFGHLIKSAKDYKDIQGSDVVVVTAGLARKPGMTRDDLLAINSKIAKEIILEIKANAPDAVIVMVTNPLDALTYLALKVSGFNPAKVIGMGASLDNARLKAIMVERLNIPAGSIDSMILGEHGDAMVILPNLVKIEGKIAKEELGEEAWEEIVSRTRNRGKEIVSLFKSGSAYVAPSAAAYEIVKSILKDENKTICACVYARDILGLGEVCLGYPVVVGRGGIKKIVDLKLSSEELKVLQASAEAIKANLNKIQNQLN